MAELADSVGKMTPEQKKFFTNPHTTAVFPVLLPLIDLCCPLLFWSLWFGLGRRGSPRFVPISADFWGNLFTKRDNLYKLFRFFARTVLLFGWFSVGWVPFMNKSCDQWCHLKTPERQKQLKWHKSDSKVTLGGRRPSDPKQGQKWLDKKGFRSLLSHFWPFLVTFHPFFGHLAPQSLLSHFNCFGVLGSLGGTTDHKTKEGWASVATLVWRVWRSRPILVTCLEALTHKHQKILQNY